MPKLGVQNIKTVYLPSTKDAATPEDKAWVKLNMSATINDVDGITSYENEVDQSAYALSQLITEWNLTNEADENIAEISIENVRKLPLQDFNYLGLLLRGQLSTQAEGVPTPLKESSSST